MGVAVRRANRLIRRLTCTTVVALFSVVLSAVAVAGASSPSAVSFTGTAPTSVVANTEATWTVGFTASSSGALGIGSTVTITLPSGFTTASSSPTVTLLTPSSFATDCAGLGQDSSESNVISILIYPAASGCALAASTAATLTIGVVNGAAGAYGPANFSVATSADTTAVAPSSGETITPTSVSAVSVTTTAPTSLVMAAASTWTWGFTTSATGALGPGGSITLTYPTGFSTLTTSPIVVLEAPSAFVTDCAATASDTSETGVIVITLANNGSNTCALAKSTAATLTVGVLNGKADALSTLSVATSKDTAGASPTGTAPSLTTAAPTSAVTFTTSAPTSLVANTTSTWTVGFTTSSSGALAAGAYIVVRLPSGFATSSTTPAVTLKTPSSFASTCTPSGSVPNSANIVVVTLANSGSNTCALGTSTAATIAVTVINGPAATYGASSYSLSTSADGTAVAPTSGSATIVSAGPPGTVSYWTSSMRSSAGEAHAGVGPTSPGSPKGAAYLSYLCASSSSEVVDLSWTGVANATSYVVEQATTASGTYSAASPAPVYSGTSATITYTTAVTEYYKVEALIGTAWVSALSSNATNGSVSSGYVVTSTSSPECTDN